jgi:hypothetical protein
VRFTSSISAASVDDFPDPVGPLTMTRPWVLFAMDLRSGWPLDRGVEGGQKADGQADAACCAERVDAAAHALDRPGQICGAALHERVPGLSIQEFLRDREERVARDRLAIRVQLASDPEGRRQPGFEVKVAGAVAPSALDERGESHEALQKKGSGQRGFHEPVIHS